MKVIFLIFVVVIFSPMNVFAEDDPSPNAENWVTYCIKHKVTRSEVCFTSVIPWDDEDGIVVILNPAPKKSDKFTLSYGGIDGFDCGESMEFNIDEKEKTYLDKVEINTKGEKNKNASYHASYNLSKVFIQQLKAGKSGVGHCGNAKFSFTLKGFTKAFGMLGK
ncbi:MAG: hypothetical protein ACQ9MH_10785 [Nitrospinales bacterium]